MRCAFYCLTFSVLLLTACGSSQQYQFDWGHPDTTETVKLSPVVEATPTTTPTANVKNLASAGDPLSTPPPAVHVQTVTPQTSMQLLVATEFGIQINACDHGVDTSLPIAKKMRLTWIKLQVRWGDMQRSESEIDWRCLDTAIPAIHRAGFKLLASVVTAPKIYRTFGSGVTGPPDDLDQYSIFLSRLIARYPKQIQAIEVWNEPNLSREWDWQIDGAVYRHLLATAYQTIKWLDPDIMVISAALAEAEFAGVWQHVDPASFVRKLRRYNGDAFTDCVGVHANGPDGPGDIQTVVPKYVALFDETKPVCVTEFGYGLPVENKAPAGFDWIMQHSEARQSEVFVRGLVWSRQNGHVRLVILWSLDYWGPPSDPNAPYALIRPDWISPAVIAVADYLAAMRHEQVLASSR